MKKNAYVLAISLGFITLITGLIYSFLYFDKEIKTQQKNQYFDLQMGAFINNMSNYLKSVELNNETLFYATKLELPIQVGEYDLILKLESMHNKISLNHILRAILLERADNKVQLYAENRFMQFLQDYNINNPSYLIDIMLDTIDKDTIERTYNSEIRVYNPRFYNGGIMNKEQLFEILDYYSIAQNDDLTYTIPWEDIFSLDNIGNIDLNYASYKVLEYLYPDANTFTLERIARGEKWYEETTDLPFDSEYLKVAIGSRYGVNIGVKSTVSKAVFTLQDDEYSSKFSFKKTLGKASKIYDIEIIND